MRLYGIFTEGKDMSKAFEDWHDKALQEYAEVLNSHSYALELAYKAGRAHQRMVDVYLCEDIYMNYSATSVQMAINAIREQKID